MKRSRVLPRNLSFPFSPQRPRAKQRSSAASLFQAIQNPLRDDLRCFRLGVQVRGRRAEAGAHELLAARVGHLRSV